jgi:hypothetical protein
VHKYGVRIIRANLAEEIWEMSFLLGVRNIWSSPSSLQQDLQAIDHTDIHQRAGRTTRTLQRAADWPRLSAYFYLGIFVLVIAFVVLRNTNWNGLIPDTMFHVSANDMLWRFSSLFSNANANPLEGLFDIFPHGLRLDMIPNLIGRTLFGPGMSLTFS